MAARKRKAAEPTPAAIPDPPPRPAFGQDRYSGFASGDLVRVVDWADREPALALEALHRIAGWYRPDESSVLVRDRIGFTLVPAEDLPAYDPVPVGCVS